MSEKDPSPRFSTLEEPGVQTNSWERAWKRLWDPATSSSYWLTRFVLLRLLGLVYLVAFATILDQGLGLLGSDGLLPAAQFLERARAQLDWPFLRLPTLFWWTSSNSFLMGTAWLGFALSLAVLFGYANSILLLALWFLYMSFVHVGQNWYSFGWEIQLLETGFLAVFLCPLLDGRPFPRRPPPILVIWLFRWLIFRIMLGAGLIKIRGDSCWRELTCLVYHYETQPVPNPLSRTLHFLPVGFHKLGVLFNHLVELAAPFFLFGSRPARRVAGGLIATFQVLLIASGNLSFLNWLTIVPALACFDDSLLAQALPRRLVERAEIAKAGVPPYPAEQKFAVSALCLVAGFLSVAPIANLISARQIMNTSFDRLQLVNTYGAFGSVGRERYELVFSGTEASTLTAETEWKDYELPCKPGDPLRRPCVISPYHYRLDWLLWFAAMSGPEDYPWSLHLVSKLLENDETVLDLFARNPFPEHPPRYVRVVRYRYRFAPPGDAAWWKREPLDMWLPPLSADDPRLRGFLAAHGWMRGR